MALDFNSSRQRALSRRSLLILIVAILLASACQLIPALGWLGHPEPEAGRANGAPPEAAMRPNPPTEPIRGQGEVRNGV